MLRAIGLLWPIALGELSFSPRPCFSMRNWIFLLCLTFLSSSCSNPPQPSDGVPGGAEFKQQPGPIIGQGKVPIVEGDRLELTVREDASLNSTYEVREGGHVMIGRLGRVQVVGLTIAEAEGAIRRLLLSSQLTKATVMIDRVSRAPRVDPRIDGDKVIVYLTGQVNRPGQHILTLPPGLGGSMGVYQAVLITGGFKEFPDLKKSYILRADETNRRHRIPVNFKEIMDGVIPDIPVGNGDVITIPDRKYF